MNENRARELFAESLKGPLPTRDAVDLEAYLASQPGLAFELDRMRDLFIALERDNAGEPGAAVRESLQAAIAAEMTSSHQPVSGRARRLDPAPSPFGRFVLAGCAAAGLLVAIGFFAGMRVGRATAPVAELRIEREGTNPALVAYAYSDGTPGTVRLERVLAEAAAGGTNPEALRRLLNALASEPSPNVRISIVQALYPYLRAPEARAAVSSRVARDPSSIVQIAMIDFITACGGDEAESTLETLSHDDAIDEIVRNAASYALAQL